MKTIIQIIVLFFVNLSICNATDYYVDPIKGSMAGNGSTSSPWRTLQEVINSHLIETKDVTGLVINKRAPIKAGDRIILRSGYHGFISIENAFNDAYITVIAGLNQKATLSGLIIKSAAKWRFSRLIISPVFLTPDDLPTNTIVEIGNSYYLNRATSGKSLYIDITNSHIYSFSETPETLLDTDWLDKAKKAVVLGQYASRLNIINNHINNNDFGITIRSPGSRVQGNIVTDFSGDGIRVSVPNILIEDNIIKNNYQVDDNHADALQGYSGQPLKNLNNISMVGNIILNRDKKSYLYSHSMQGIGFFDGPLHNVKALDNIVMAFSGHGISLYDSVNGQITHNVVFTPAQITMSSNVGSVIRLSTKNRGGNIDNTVTDNISHGYSFTSSIGLIRSGNKTIAKGAGKALFMNRLKERLQAINTKYGIVHPVSNQVRVDDNFMLYGPASIF